MPNNPITQTIDVGLFRSRATFLNDQPIANGSGGFTDNLVPVLTCWGMLRQNQGMRNLITGEIELTNDYTLIVRYQTALANLNWSKTLIQIDTRTFTINSSTKVEEMNFFYQFNLKQKDH